ncbi:microtubule-associated protein futsch [Drosophila biarmipes]|uniref:microtubule-associated protein futsch n=1 Tax=Drosophila biarmipes TaxID=125945 RepID=UPI0007E70C3D|nr:microtubule-associated protein futsch [Drosophila biarmipes]
MSKPQNDDTLELDEILSQPVKDKERFAAFMLRKLAENKPPQNGNLFGNFKLDFDLDFDGPLVKKAKVPEAQPTVLRELPSATGAAPPQSNKPVDQASSENKSPLLTSPTLSPNHRRSLRRSGNVPGSDKLRRHAIRRRSRSCGRQLLPEFEEAVNLTRSLSSPVNFVPEISSTPCTDKPKQDDLKTAVNLSDKSKEPTEKQAVQPEKPAEKPVKKSLPPEVKSPARTSILAAEIEQICKERQNSFYNNVLQLDYTGRAPYSRPSTPPSPSVAGLQRTYTMKKGPAPGQLLLSPSNRFKTIIKSPVVKLKRTNHEVTVPDTPQRPNHEPAWQSQPQPEFVVPETQPQDLGDLVQTLSRSASGPIVVINTANLNQSVRRNSVQVETPRTSPVVRSFSQPVSSAERFTAPPPPETKGQTSRVVENLDAIVTDDESDEQPSTVALNLAPPGGNTTRQRRLRNSNRVRATADTQESSMCLLNLHRSDNTKKSKPRMTTVPLNKAPSAPINGEQFANELARMSNYEILDLRKRISNEGVPLNGHKRRSEMLIQQELLRRKMMDERDGLPRERSTDDSEEENISVTRRTRSSKRAERGRPRSKRRDPPMTTELKNYLGLSTTMETRRKLSKEGKRSLYTKGDSHVEDYDSPSPEKMPRLSKSIQIVPPPPVSLRYSRSMQNLRRSTRFDFDDIVMDAPPGFHNTTNSETIPIVPPPPEYFVNTRNRSTVGRKSQKENLVAPPPEYDEQSEEDEQHQRSHGRARSSQQAIGRKKKENELVPPPIEYIEEPEIEAVKEQSCNDEISKGSQLSLQPRQNGQKSKKDSVVPPPTEYINPSKNGDAMEQDRNNEPPRGSLKNTRKTAEHNATNRNTEDKLEPIELPEPPEHDNDDTDSDIEQPRSLRSIRKKWHNLKPSVQKAKQNGVVPPPIENNGTPDDVEDEEREEEVRMSQGKGKEFQKKKLSTAKLQQDEEVPLRFECIQGSDEKAQKSTLTPSASEISSIKKKRNNRSVSRSKDVDQLPKSLSSSHNDRSVSRNEDVDQLPKSLSNSHNLSNKGKSPNPISQEEEIIERSEQMETLRVNTPTPPLAGISRDLSSKNRTVHETSLDDDDVPSTSRAALEALHRSQRLSKNKPQDVTNDEAMFKKPVAPAPRARTKKAKSELDKLKLLKIPVNLDETSGVRRSKRGHVPLQMSWCHTMDPWQFDFMSGYKEPAKKNSKGKKANLTKTKKSSTAKPKVAEQDNLAANRGPLCSSTPRNAERGSEAMPNSESLGISPLAWEDTAPSAVQAVVKKATKKKGSSKKKEEVVQTEVQSEPDTEPEEAMPSSVTRFRNDHDMDAETEPAPEPQPIEPPATPSRDEQEEASIQLMHWLRGVRDGQPTPGKSDENASVSTANELVFTQVDGIDYAFYNTKEKATLGYMRFQPHQTRNKKRARVHPLKFIVQFGEFAVQTLAEGDDEEVHAVLRVGDMIEVEKGTKYSIQNAIDEVGVLLVIRT